MSSSACSANTPRSSPPFPHESSRRPRPARHRPDTAYPGMILSRVRKSLMTLQRRLFATTRDNPSVLSSKPAPTGNSLKRSQRIVSTSFSIAAWGRFSDYESNIRKPVRLRHCAESRRAGHARSACRNGAAFAVTRLNGHRKKAACRASRCVRQPGNAPSPKPDTGSSPSTPKCTGR